MDTSQNITGSTYIYLKQQCDEVGISLTQLCREAGVERSTIERWKQKDPNTIEILNNLKAVLESKKQQINTHE